MMFAYTTIAVYSQAAHSAGSTVSSGAATQKTQAPAAQPIPPAIAQQQKPVAPAPAPTPVGTVPAAQSIPPAIAQQQKPVAPAPVPIPVPVPVPQAVPLACTEQTMTTVKLDPKTVFEAAKPGENFDVDVTYLTDKHELVTIGFIAVPNTQQAAIALTDKDGKPLNNQKIRVHPTIPGAFTIGQCSLECLKRVAVTMRTNPPQTVVVPLAEANQKSRDCASHATFVISKDAQGKLAVKKE